MLDLKEKLGDEGLYLVFASIANITAHNAIIAADNVDVPGNKETALQNFKRSLIMLDVATRELCIPIDRNEWNEAAKSLKNILEGKEGA